MNVWRYVLSGLLVIFSMGAQALPQANSHHDPAITQGISGHVLFWQGDFMPGMDEDRGNIKPVVRTVYIHVPTKAADITQADNVHAPFYSQINTQRIAEVTSDEKGFFSVALEPGTYSLFVKEDTANPPAYYANLTDGDGVIFPVTVKAGEVAEIEFDITYQSVH